ncbi:hypothetical protein F1643_09245 [Azospirillum sp. INR13]|nr:hypothetical protein [Azospirillum sp. INR13]
MIRTWISYPCPTPHPSHAPHGPLPSPGAGEGAYHQNRKYRCAIGRTSAGSQVSSCPSARTS